RGYAGASSGQHHPVAGVHGGGDRLGHPFGAVRDDLHRSDVVAGLTQAARRLGSRTVLTFAASAPVGDRDHRYRHVLGHASRVPMRGLSRPEMVTYTTHVRAHADRPAIWGVSTRSSSVSVSGRAPRCPGHLLSCRLTILSLFSARAPLWWRADHVPHTPIRLRRTRGRHA